MNEIFSRTSTRYFTDQPVTKEQIDDLLRAGMQAPSAANQQPWEFYVVRNRKVLDELSGLSPYAKPLQRATLGIILCSRINTIAPEYQDIDMAIASENILLEAESLGLGAVMLGVAPLEDRMNYVKRVLDLPENLKAFAVIAIGVKRETKEVKSRFEPDRVHYIN